MAKIDFEKYRREREQSLKIHWKWARYDNDADQLKKLYGKFMGGRRKKTASTKSSGFLGGIPYSGWNPESDKQFVMVKMRYSDKLDSHNKFLQDYITQQNKEEVKVKPTVFSARLNPFSNSGQRKVVYGQEAVEDYKSCMTGRHYKFIISPDSSKVPMEEFTTAFMHRMQAEMGVKLDWVAAVHTDTGHPHVHILVNGATADGFTPKRLFRKDFVSHRCRIIASDIVTDMIGVRSAEQKRQSLDKSFTSLRWTNHDKLIAEHTKDGVVIAVNE